MTKPRAQILKDKPPPNAQWVVLPPPVRVSLQLEANRRRTTVEALIAELLTTIARDELWAAVLDE